MKKKVHKIPTVRIILKRVDIGLEKVYQVIATDNLGAIQGVLYKIVARIDLCLLTHFQVAVINILHSEDTGIVQKVVLFQEKIRIVVRLVNDKTLITDYDVYYEDVQTNRILLS